jgi:hypothetical protein
MPPTIDDCEVADRPKNKSMFAVAFLTPDSFPLQEKLVSINQIRKRTQTHSKKLTTIITMMISINARMMWRKLKRSQVVDEVCKVSFHLTTSLA